MSSGAQTSLPDTVTVIIVATETPKMESSCSNTGSTPLWGLGALALSLVLSRRRRSL